MGTVTKSVKLIPSGYSDLTNLTTTSSYPVANGYHDETNTSYARLTITQSATGSMYYLFDTSDIPANATIVSVTAKARARVSNTTRVTNTKCQLYSGTTAKGSNSTFATTTNPPTAITLTPGTWTRSELNDLRLFVGGTGSSSTSSRYIYFYGASVTITYTVPTYDITIQNGTGATVTASNTSPEAGEDVEIVADTLSGLTVTDNGIDVTSQFVSGLSGTAESYPDSYDTGGSINGTRYQNTIGHSVANPSSSTGSDYFSTTQGASGSTWIDYFFDFSEVPAGATIKAMTVQVRGHAEDISQSREIARVQLYSGSTAKGNSVDFTSNSDANYTISNYGSWTAAELANAKIRFTIGVYGGLMTGATWSVTYEIDGYVYTITNVAANHTIVVTAGAGNPPVITVGTPSRTIISDESGYDQCVCTFRSDQALQAWEARATKSGVTPARGVGLLVESGTTLAANTDATIYVENEELTNGDGEYTITVYGQSTGGVWSG